MKKYSQEIFDNLTEAAEIFLKDRLRLFCKEHIERMEMFNNSIIKSVESLKNLPDEDSSESAAWQIVENCVLELDEWVDFKAYQPFRGGILTGCSDHFLEIIKEHPENYEEFWDKSFFAKNDDETVATYLFKKSKVLKRKAGNMVLFCTNFFRSEKREHCNDSHILKTQLFVEFFFHHPFKKFLSTATDKLSGLVSVQFDDFHEFLLSYMAAALMTKKEDCELRSELHVGLKDRLLERIEILPDTRVMEEALRECRDEIMTSFNIWQEQAAKTFVRKSSFTGTWILPHYRYGHLLKNKKEKAQKKTHDKIQKLWGDHFNGEEKDWTHELALYKCQVIFARMTIEATETISDKIRQKIIPGCSDAIDILIKTGERIGSLQADHDWELKKKMIHESRTLVQKFRHEMISAIASRFLGAGIGKDLNLVFKGIADNVELMTDTHTIFKSKSTGIPPHSEVIEIPIKDLFKEELLVKLQDVLKNYEHQLRMKINEVVNTMSEIRQSVEFNVETSFGLLENKDYTEDACKMVTEGIERSSVQLAALKEKLELIPEETAQNLGEIAFNWNCQVQGLQDNEKLIALKLKLTKARASSRLKKFSVDTKKKIRSLFGILTDSKEKIKKQSSKFSQKLQFFLGLTMPDEDVQVQFTQFLLDTQHKLDALPFVYQQLFQIEPLTESRLFFGREDELKGLKDDIESWDKNRNSVTTVIVGEKGSGKTTLLNQFEIIAPQKFSVRSCRLSATVRSAEDIISAFADFFPEKKFETLKELESHLLNISNPVIALVENIHNLYIKNMEGFDRLEYFTGLMHRTRQKILWICSCAQYSWEYLDKSINISRAFNRVVLLKPFTGKQIETMILERHRITGYQLKFEVSKKMAMSRKFKNSVSEAEQQSILKRNFFEQIQKIASGNISVAILFWLRSIESIKENELQLSSEIEFNVKFLSVLNAKDLFTLGAIAQHETLTVEDHALVFRQTPRNSFLTLNALSRMGILQLTEKHYCIHPFLYRHIIRSLKLQNILH